MSKTGALNIDPNRFLPDEPTNNKVLYGVLPQGQNLIKLTANGNLLTAQQPAILQVAQDIHIKVVDQKLFFSLDQDTWKPFDQAFSFDYALDLKIDAEGKVCEPALHFLCLFNS